MDPSFAPPVADPVELEMLPWGATAATPMDAATLPPELPADPLAGLRVGPEPPIWYRKPPRPKKDEVLEDAEAERSDHEDRVARALVMTELINQERRGGFESHAELIEDGVVEQGRSTALRDEHDFGCQHISEMGWQVKALYRDAVDAEESAAKEAAVNFFHECEERAHLRAGNGPLKWALPDVLQKYGMLVGFDDIDPANEECGLRMRLVDPATCFPIHEGERGLAAMFRVYHATAAQVIGDFGDAKGAVERKVRKAAKAGGERYDRTWVGRVVEYWDRNWCLVCFADEVVLQMEHGLAEVPFTVAYTCVGAQNFVGTTLLGAVRGDGFGVVLRETGSRRADLARTCEPFLWRRVDAHLFYEAVMGLYATAFKRSLFPPYVLKQSMNSAAMGEVLIDFSEGGMTSIREDDDVVPLANVPMPEIQGPILQFLQANIQTGQAPGVLAGQMPGAQSSGTAVEIMSQNGAARYAPLVSSLAAFLTERAEKRLRYWRDWGAVLGADGDRGTLFVPRRRKSSRGGDTSPVHALTPEMLRRAGTRVEVTLRRFSPANITAVANTVMILRNAGLMPKRDGIELVGWSDDPDGVIERLKLDMLDETPEVQQADALIWLLEDVEHAMSIGDQRSAERGWVRFRHVAELVDMANQQKLLMTQAGMGMGGNPDELPGLPQPPTGGPNVPQDPNALLPGEPGTNGGAPAQNPNGPMGQPAVAQPPETPMPPLATGGIA